MRSSIIKINSDYYYKVVTDCLCRNGGQFVFVRQEFNFQWF